MNKKSQQGVALIWVIIAGVLLVIGAGTVSSKKQSQKVKELPGASPTPQPTPPPIQEDIYQQEPLLKILPPKERAELESAINETQRVLQDIEVFNFTVPTADDIKKSLDQINKQGQEEMQKEIEKQQQEFQQKYQQEIDLKKIEEYFNQNPPAVPHEVKQLPPEAQEYYYRKYILKDPAVQY